MVTITYSDGHTEAFRLAENGVDVEYTEAVMSPDRFSSIDIDWDTATLVDPGRSSDPEFATEIMRFVKTAHDQ